MILNWGVLGYGLISKVFINSFNNVENSRVYAVASNSKVLQPSDLSDQKIKIYSDYEKLLKDDDINIVYIANTNNFHKDTVIKAIKYNKNILLEKPAFLNICEFNECVQLLKNKNLFFMEAIMYLHHPQTTKIAEIILNGEIGKIISIKASIGFNINKTFLGFIRKRANKNSRLLNINLGGGAINDIGCYPVSAARFISNLISNKDLKVERISARAIFASSSVDIFSNAKIKFNNNIQSEFDVAINKNLKSILEIKGEKGILSLFNPWTPNNNFKINIQKNLLYKKTYNFNCEKNLYAYQINDVVQNINKGNRETAGYGMKVLDTKICTTILGKWKQAISY
jgi:predicted dehydrogenase